MGALLDMCTWTAVSAVTLVHLLSTSGLVAAVFPTSNVHPLMRFVSSPNTRVCWPGTDVASQAITVYSVAMWMKCGGRDN